VTFSQSGAREAPDRTPSDRDVKRFMGELTAALIPSE
jgi:hypothetical protein